MEIFQNTMQYAQCANNSKMLTREWTPGDLPVPQRREMFDLRWRFGLMGVTGARDKSTWRL